MPEDDKQQLKKLARGIVLAQGNVFIKELLRKHGITYGATKAEFEKSLIAAIDDGELKEQQFEKWLAETEGWGDAHVYLYAVPKETADDPAWRDPDRLLARAEEGRLKKYWQAKSSLAFPTKRELTGIYLDNGWFRVVWHEGADWWVREKDKKIERWEGQDFYQYRGYRRRVQRSVMRFEYKAGTRAAALFMQIPWSKAAHAAAKDQVWMILRRFLDVETLEEKRLGRAVKTLDKQTLTEEGRRKSRIASQSSWFLSKKGEAYVRFGSKVSGVDYAATASVRRVRRAVPSDFQGEEGVFHFLRKKPQPRQTKAITVRVYVSQNRIRIDHQCNRSDAHRIISGILRCLR